MDLPIYYSGCHTAYGPWSLDGNNVTYILEGNDPENQSSLYLGLAEKVLGMPELLAGKAGSRRPSEGVRLYLQ